MRRPDLILTVDDRIASITLSPDSKRLILETHLEKVNSNDSSASSELADSFGVEIWNIELGDARPEAFSRAMPYLIASKLGSAAFDEEGERVFWICQSARKTIALGNKALSLNAVVRGAVADESPLAEPCSSKPLYLASTPQESVRSDEVEPSLSLFLDDEISSIDASLDAPLSSYVQPLLPPDTNQQEDALFETGNFSQSPLPTNPQNRRSSYSSRDVENVLLTKPFESGQLIMSSQAIGKKVDLSAKRMKIADETRFANTIRLSPNARWIICKNFAGSSPYRLMNLAETNDVKQGASNAIAVVEEPETPTENETDAEIIVKKNQEPYDANWALVPLRDRKRVVRFPATIKMTFDSSTSNEEILGRVVDVLDVSDQGDLVATLVEEIHTKGSATDTPIKTTGLNGTLRSKIVIWDIQVAKTVEFDKAKKPLRALEVAQIAIPYPVERRFCKFSPSGKTFAARIEPKCISIWQSASGRLVSELGDHAGAVQSFAFAPGETKVIVGTSGNRARLSLWEIRKELVYRTLEDDSVGAKSIDAVVFSNDENHVYYANDLGEVKRWDARPVGTME